MALANIMLSSTKNKCEIIGAFGQILIACKDFLSTDKKSATDTDLAHRINRYGDKIFPCRSPLYGLKDWDGFPITNTKKRNYKYITHNELNQFYLRNPYWGEYFPRKVIL